MLILVKPFGRFLFVSSDFPAENPRTQTRNVPYTKTLCFITKNGQPMIKFFRKIRQNLLLEGKTGKYFKYAIGEIILVVIGILIALWINNWNNQRITDNQSKFFLKNIKEDLVSDTLAIDNYIKYYKKNIERKKKLLLISEFDNTSSDSLFAMISSSSIKFEPNITTFTKVSNLGISELTKNVSLSKKLYAYYTTDLKIFNSLINWEFESSIDESKYWYNIQNEVEIIDDVFPKFQDSITNRQNFIKLIKEPRGRNTLLGNYYRKELILSQYGKKKNIAVSLINEINDDLNLN
ncbi:DUF6090 family protein [Paucihalobacter sp.]|uniref:DUF6090 family protein n=1 Tax=Paucihalobacter sp. TaxID=2850405 RepID=UPI003D1620BC